MTKKKNGPFLSIKVALCISVFLMFPACQQPELGAVPNASPTDVFIPTATHTITPPKSPLPPTWTTTALSVTSTPVPDPSATPPPEEYEAPTLYLALDTPVYIGGDAQIWAVNSFSSVLLYQRDPLSVLDPLVPPEIQKRIQKYFQNLESFNETTLTPVFSDLTTSADKKYLAFIEGFHWARVEVEESFRRLLILDVAQKEAIAEIPADAIVVESLAWSPAGDYLLFATSSRDQNYNRISETWLYDLPLDQLIRVGEGSLATWSPDGSHIAFANSDRITIVSSVDIETDVQVINFPKDTALQTLSWEIDNLILGAAYVNANFTIGPQKLYLINPKTLLFSEYLPESPLPVLSSPRVSPNGELVGLNAKKNDSDSIDYLLVFNLRGDLIMNFEIPRAIWEMWTWTPDGQRIFVLLGAQPGTLQQDIGILDPLTGKFEMIQLPTEIRTELEDNSHIISWIGW
jgi:dipeptidyl aminopeptidase/acylaminoacyl peptidase